MCMHVGKLQLAMSPLHALALQRSRSRGTSCVCDLGALHCEHTPPPITATTLMRSPGHAFHAILEERLT